MARVHDSEKVLMKPTPTIMILDGEYTHTVSVQQEIKRRLNATILSVASMKNSPGHVSVHSDLKLFAPIPSNENYGNAILRLAHDYHPDIILPVGFESHKAVLSIKGSLPPGVKLPTPELTLFDLASDKNKTYEFAENIGLKVPKYYFSNSTSKALPMDSLRFPLFAKSRHERGGESTALLRSERDLSEFDPETLGGDVIFQEYIDGPAITYAHCGYYDAGVPRMTYQHVELLSVPRRGGSGSRVSLVSDRAIAEAGNLLMQKLEWTGYAQVEFKKNGAGEPVLMEINPKLWASYALADRTGHPIVATAIADLLGRPELVVRRRSTPFTSMIFPLRELNFMRKNWKTESLVKSISTMVWPPSTMDVDLTNIRAYLPRRIK